MSSRNRDIARILGKTEAANPNNTSLKATGGSTAIGVYSSLDSLPTTSLTAGDQAYVSANSRLYVSNGSGWYNVAVVNATPTLSLSASGTIALASDGSTTTVIRLTGTDSDNADANLVYSIESGGDFFKLATIVQDSAKQYTITPRTEAAATALGFDGSATLTFKASDGVNQATVQNTFTLSFVSDADWTGTVGLTEVNYDYIISNTITYAQFSKDGMATSRDGNYIGITYNKGIGPTSGGGVEDIGAVFVYQNNNGTVTNQTIVQPDGHAAQETSFGDNAQFGWDVDFDNDASRMIVGGAKWTSTGVAQHGQAFVFTRSGSNTWTQEAAITAEGGNVASMYFGSSVAMSKDGDTVAIGARNRTHSGITGAGSIFIYTRSGTTWSYQATLAPSDSGIYYAGNHVSIDDDGDRVAFGTNYSDFNGVANNGGFFVFKRTGSSWAEEAHVVGGAAGRQMGVDTMISGDGETVVVGHGDYQYIMIYTRSGSTWSNQATFTSSTYASNDKFGESVAISKSGNIAIATAWGDDDDGTSSGNVFIFKRTGTNWAQVTKKGPGVAGSQMGRKNTGQGGIGCDAGGNNIIVGAQEHNSSSFSGSPHHGSCFLVYVS
jgi:hypothetical protein